MKLDAKVEILIDDAVLGVTAGQEVIILVDSDYVESSKDDVIEWVANELESKYGTIWVYGTDFIITNMEELVEDLAYDDFLEKTEGTR